LAGSLLEAGADAGPLAERAAALARGGADAAAVAAGLVDEGSLVLGTDADALLPLADVVVAATSSTAPVLRPGQLRPGAVVCDVARPLDADPAVGLERPDALVVEGGLVELPEGADLGWDFGLPPATVFACMCEPMMLALERRYELARVGVETPPELLRTLRGWAAEHGFRPAPPRSFGRPVSDEDWRRVRAARAGGIASPVRGA
ncbi:MAG: aminotransferase III, partial [Thermoleophilia bacterium]|nr:aminotransferase III [Thermoleophilia bacterium]